MPTRLTEKKIRGLAKPKTQTDLLHEKTPAAGLRLAPSGSRIWFYMYRSPTQREPNGVAKQRRVYLGYHPSGRRPDRTTQGPDLPPLSVEEFERAYDVLRGKLASGIDPRAEKEVSAEVARYVTPETLPPWLRGLYPAGYQEGTFGALMADYFLKHAQAQLRPRTLQGYKQTAQTHLDAWMGLVPSEITDQTVRSILSKVEARAPQMVRAVKKVISNIFEYGRSHWYLTVNPTRGIQVLVKKGKRDRWLSDAELVATLATFDRLSDRKAADVYMLILASLCRPGEAAYARAEDILRLNGERVWRIQAKNGRDFLIPLLGPIGEILNRRCLEVGGQGPLFWAGTRTKDYPPELQDANAEFRALSELKNVRPHDWRRTGRTHLPSLGVLDSVSEALLNHSKSEIEGTYNLYEYWEERKEALRRWQEKLTRLQTGALESAA
ncbi:MAG TPA: integrase arm-type DNA-binding domain-containing protein [Thermoanaerobaculia bacterium]|nr:integrase arm-type DNA-binding domain-containing protein [Thermoanaerobaculia bacterium]